MTILLSFLNDQVNKLVQSCTRLALHIVLGETTKEYRLKMKGSHVLVILVVNVE